MLVRAPCTAQGVCRLSYQSTGSRAALALLYLAEFQLDRRVAAKNRHRDLEPEARLIDLLNNTIEGREGTIRDTNLLTYLEGNRGLRLLEVVHGQETQKFVAAEVAHEAPLHQRTEKVGACLADPFANGEGAERTDTFTFPKRAQAAGVSTCP